MPHGYSTLLNTPHEYMYKTYIKAIISQIIKDVIAAYITNNNDKNNISF